MRMAGRFSRRVHGYAKAENILRAPARKSGKIAGLKIG
jgi:hypothetical protein